MIFITVLDDGRVGAATTDERFSQGMVQVQEPEEFDFGSFSPEDWVYEDGNIKYDPLPEPEPPEDPVKIANDAKETAEEAKAIAEQAGTDPSVMAFARMAVIPMAATMTDEQAISVSTLWPEWSAASVSYKVDDVVQHADHLWRCEQAHTSQADWTPDAAPSLWSQIDIAGDGVDVWTQPTGAHNAYNVGDRVHYPTASDPIYVSLIDGNVWAPDAYPAGWQLEE